MINLNEKENNKMRKLKKCVEKKKKTESNLEVSTEKLNNIKSEKNKL